MKRNKNTLISLLVIFFFIVGVIMAYFCNEGWQRVFGIIILIIDVAIGIDFLAEGV